MRTLSARILLGFIALTIAFSVFAATIVVYLREVEDQASLILRGYVPLTMASSDLARQQEYLRTYLDQGIMDATRAREVATMISRLRANRDAPLKEIVNKIDSLDQPARCANFPGLPGLPTPGRPSRSWSRRATRAPPSRRPCARCSRSTIRRSR